MLLNGLKGLDLVFIVLGFVLGAQGSNGLKWGASRTPISPFILL